MQIKLRIDLFMRFVFFRTAGYFVQCYFKCLLACCCGSFGLVWFSSAFTSGWCLARWAVRFIVFLQYVMCALHSLQIAFNMSSFSLQSKKSKMHNTCEEKSQYMGEHCSNLGQWFTKESVGLIAGQQL